MKFRDPKTGEVFEDIEKARTKFCTGTCSKCVLDDHVSLLNCREYYSDSPAEAARLMGFEIIEEEPMDKPRICEVLGVEQFEQICEAVHNGWWDEKKRQGVADHPDMIPYDELAEDVKEYDRVTVRRVMDALGIRYERKPNFTEKELPILGALYFAGVRWLAREEKHLRWYVKKPFQREADGKWDMRGDWGTMSGKLPAKLFPGLCPGKLVRIQDVLERTAAADTPKTESPDRMPWA